MKLPGVKFSWPAGRRSGRRTPAASGDPGKAGKSAWLYLGAGAAALVGMGALGWIVLWPLWRGRDAPPAPLSPAQAAAERKPDAEPAKPVAILANASPAEPQAAPAASPAPPSEPERLVRQLQDAQERVAAGDRDAYAKLPGLLHSIGRSFSALPPESWQAKQNARALALYLLSGGDSAIGRKILQERRIAPSDEALAKGAIAYLDGIDCADRDALLNLDPRALDPALAAQVAFVQSILLASVDPRKALARLDLARLLAPGGLVEEAALRREIGLLGEMAEFDRFASLSRQYWTRFSHSPYAENFMRQFTTALARIGAQIKMEQWADLEEVIAGESQERRLALYLAMAKSAAVAGNSAFGAFSAQRAIDLSAPGSVERRRALLYRGAGQVAEAGAMPGQAPLGEIERGRLPAADQPLYDAAALVYARIFRAPDATAPDPGGVTDETASLAQARLKDAEQAMASARESMERKSR